MLSWIILILLESAAKNGAFALQLNKVEKKFKIISLFQVTAMDDKARNVKVVCRFRPLNEREKGLGNCIVH